MKLVESYRAGNAVNQLAREFGISRQTIAAILDRHGIEHRQQRLSTDEIAEASRLYESGWSLARVGNHLDVNASTVLNVLRRIGAKIRPVGTNQWR